MKQPRIAFLILRQSSLYVSVGHYIESCHHCLCVYIKQNPDYMKDNFFISIESMHFDDDLGKQENVSLFYFANIDL